MRVAESPMIIERVWEMPNKFTFDMQCVAELLESEMDGNEHWVDPFAGMHSPATHTNDCNEASPAQSHKDGLEFLRSLLTEKFDGGLFDPPYSVEQALRSYKAKFGGTAGREEYHARCKDELARLIRPGGKAICFGWNSGGLGRERGFYLDRILLVCHGAAHYDTIVTVEHKIQGELFLAERRP